jgi:hypothetical protein
MAVWQRLFRSCNPENEFQDAKMPTSSSGPTRRQLLHQIGIHGLTLALASRVQARPVDPKQPAPAWTPLNRFPRMVQEYFVARVRAAEQAGLQARAALQTRADAEAYVELVRKKIRLCFGPLPARTPLHPRITGKIQRDAFTVEKLIFESRPRFLVTANL